MSDPSSGAGGTPCLRPRSRTAQGPVDGTQLEGAIARLFRPPGVAYLHAHYATRGCYAARIDRR